MKAKVDKGLYLPTALKIYGWADKYTYTKGTSGKIDIVHCKREKINELLAEFLPTTAI